MNYIFLIIVSIFLGNLQTLLDIIYVATSNFYGSDLLLFHVLFVILHPLAYAFVFLMYTLPHPNAEQHWKDKLKYWLISPLFAVLMYLRILPYIHPLYKLFMKWTHIN